MKTLKKTFAIVIASALAVGAGTGKVDAERAKSFEVTAERPAISIGKLIRSGRTRNGTPKFSLVDDSGTVTAQVIPVTGLNLGKHVNKQVGITARTVKRGSDNLLYILAQNATVLNGERLNTKATESEVVDIDEEFGLDLPEELSADGLFTHLETASPLDKVKPVGAAVADGAQEIPFGIDESGIVGPGMNGTIISDGTVVHEGSFAGDAMHHGTGFSGCPDCGGSGGTCLPGCTPRGPYGRFWIRAEYLLWWTKGMDIPALVTTGPSSQLPQNAGVLGQTGTEILYGDGEILDTSRSGGRFRFGRWCDFCNTIGWDVDFFFLSDESETFSQLSTGAPILARPFFNTELGRNDSELVAFPGIVNGSMDVTTSTEMYSVSPRVRYNLCSSNFYANPASACTLPDGCGGIACPQYVLQRLDLLLGYRYTNLEESLRTRELLSTNQNGLPTTFDLQDSFMTENEFHGFEIGLQWERYRGPWSLEWIGRVALGNNREMVAISGNTTSSTNGADFADPGGLLALSSNVGTYKNNTFAAIPEMDVTLGYRIGPSLQFVLGYTLLYWNDLVRPGDQIDTSINPNLIPPIQAGGDDRPAFTLNESDIWAQGLSFGLDYRW